ncbi:MAG: hypothetical protein M3Z64_02160, partial [Verrucomicrobiota bacterium]|nr:hypothetical protein [Verrucomicrobiota bacterium]
MRDALSARLISLLAFAVALGLTSCATTGHHFAEPASDWQARNGQLLYRSHKTSLIGEVLVRFSKAGDFELTFTKGPGVTLLMVQQDANFVRVSGPLARGSWSGPPASAPARLRGWVELRDVLMKAAGQTSVQHEASGDV